VGLLLGKERRLREYLNSKSDVVVAFSGGVDSSYLAVVASQELGPRALCVMGVSPSVSEYQRKSAIDFADRHGLNLRVVETGEVAKPEYVANNPDRCFHCKSELYSVLGLIPDASESILDGTNADDLKDFRPGRRAASERGVISPLAEIGFSKMEIRELSKRMGLETWDVPASPCLSSRIAHGTAATPQRLQMVETAEGFLRSLGFLEFRVRVHDEIARVEIARNEIERFLDTDTFEEVATRFKEIGFRFVTLDLEGFRSGSMNPDSGKRIFNIKR